MSLDEILKNNILNLFHQMMEVVKREDDSEVMDQKHLMEFLYCGDRATLKKYYIYQPDFPYLDCQENRWSKTQVRAWLANHTVKYKEMI